MGRRRCCGVGWRICDHDDRHRKNRHSNDSPLKKNFPSKIIGQKKRTPKKWTEKKRTMNLENTNVSMASPQKQTRNKDSQQEEEKKTHDSQIYATSPIYSCITERYTV